MHRYNKYIRSILSLNVLCHAWFSFLGEVLSTKKMRAHPNFFKGSDAHFIPTARATNKNRFIKDNTRKKVIIIDEKIDYEIRILNIARLLNQPIDLQVVKLAAKTERTILKLKKRGISVPEVGLTFRSYNED